MEYPEQVTLQIKYSFVIIMRDNFRGSRKDRFTCKFFYDYFNLFARRVKYAFVLRKQEVMIKTVMSF